MKIDSKRLVLWLKSLFDFTYENIPCKIQRGCGWCGESGADYVDPDFNCVHCDGTGVDFVFAKLSSNGIRLLRECGYQIRSYEQLTTP